jgi:hypothetical protein
MIYIPIRSDAAPYLSAAIYQLTRPPHLRDSKDVSLYYCEWIPHPNRPEVATLVVPETEDIPVHVQADASKLAELLEPFVDKELTRREVEDIARAVSVQAGRRANVREFIPASWQPYVMDHETAVSQGWIEP